MSWRLCRLRTCAQNTQAVGPCSKDTCSSGSSLFPLKKIIILVSHSKIVTIHVTLVNNRTTTKIFQI